MMNASYVNRDVGVDDGGDRGRHVGTMAGRYGNLPLRYPQLRNPETWGHHSPNGADNGECGVPASAVVDSDVGAGSHTCPQTRSEHHHDHHCGGCQFGCTGGPLRPPARLQTAPRIPWRHSERDRGRHVGTMAGRYGNLPLRYPRPRNPETWGHHSPNGADNGECGVPASAVINPPVGEGYIPPVAPTEAAVEQRDVMAADSADECGPSPSQQRAAHVLALQILRETPRHEENNDRNTHTHRYCGRSFRCWRGAGGPVDSVHYVHSVHFLPPPRLALTHQLLAGPVHSVVGPDSVRPRGGGIHRRGGRPGLVPRLCHPGADRMDRGMGGMGQKARNSVSEMWGHHTHFARSPGRTNRLGWWLPFSTFNDGNGYGVPTFRRGGGICRPRGVCLNWCARST